jgi:hypothetical protein
MRVVRGGGVEQLEDTLMKPAENIEISRIGEPGPKEYGTSCSGDPRSHGRKFWDSFTPCAEGGSLLKISHLAAKNALPGDVILFSPACSSFDQYRKNQGGEKVCLRGAKTLAPTMGGRNTEIHHNMQAVAKTRLVGTPAGKINLRLAPGFFEEKPRRKITTQKTYLTMKGR